MSEAFLIMLREGFEAALVVAIVFTYLRKIGRGDLAGSVWIGVGGGLALATGVGIGVHLAIGNLDGEARLITFAMISFAAAIVLTWMVFWMRRQGGQIKGELEARIDTAVATKHAGRGLLLVAFTAVLREGIEAALFLIAAAVGVDGNAVLFGGILGLLAAAGLGVFVYAGGRRIPMQLFFRVTGVILILFAAGLLAKGVFLLQAAGDLGTANDAAYNLTRFRWLTIDTESGKFLAGLFGWDPRPSIEQVAVWLCYFVPVVVWFLGSDVRPRRAVPAG
jgi:high-affinity iron transporter